MKVFALEIVTPDGAALAEPVHSIVVPAVEGLLGVLPGHAPFLCMLRPGTIRIRREGGDLALATGGGFLEVTAEKTMILADSVERPAQIDVERAGRSLDRARGRLRSTDPAVDRDRAERAFDRARTRLKLSREAGKG